MKGYVDQVEGNQIIGWCAPAVPGTPAMVCAKIDSIEVAKVSADIERVDVKDAGICEARCGFELIVPLRAFDEQGQEFSVTLERLEDGVIIAESVSVNSRGDKWIWSPADLAVIVKEWHESSAAECAELRRRLLRFDMSNLVAVLMEYGFFGEVEAALATRTDPGNDSESWLTLSDEACTDLQIKRWALECRLKAASARARAALLEAKFLDDELMPVFREALANDMVEPSDWLTLLDLYILCPAADSIDDFIKSATGFFIAKQHENDPVIDACLCYGLMQATVDKDDRDNGLFSMPVQDGLIWPQFQSHEPRKSVQVSLVLFVSDEASPEACHESVLSILNQNAQGLQLLIVGNTNRIAAKTRERMDRCEGVEVCFFPGNSECIDLIRDAADNITGEYVGWFEAGEILGPGAPGSIFPNAAESREESDSAAFVFDTAVFTRERISARSGASHLAELSPDRLTRIEEDWLDHQFLSDGWFLVTPDIFAEGVNLLPALAGPDALQYALCFAIVSRQERVRHCAKTGLYRPIPLQPVEPLHTREIFQQAGQRSLIVKESFTSPGAERHLRTLLGKHFASDEPRITIMSSRLGKIFSPDTAREIREHFSALGYQANFVETINPDQIVPGQLILILVHQYGTEEQLIPMLAKRFPDCPLIGWFWDNHHQALGNVEIAQHFHACIAAHDFCREVLLSQRNVLLPSVPLCVTQWTAAEAKTLFAKHGHGDRSRFLYGGFVRYATAVRRNGFVATLQKHLDTHALNLVEEYNLSAYFALPTEERFAEWCRYRTSLCLPLFRDLSQRFFDALLCGQVPVVTDDIVDMSKVVRDHPGLAKLFEVLKGHDIVGIEDVLEGVHQRSENNLNLSPMELHLYALSHHMLRNRLESIVSSLKTYVDVPLSSTPLHLVDRNHD